MYSHLQDMYHKPSISNTTNTTDTNSTAGNNVTVPEGPKKYRCNYKSYITKTEDTVYKKQVQKIPKNVSATFEGVAD